MKKLIYPLFFLMNSFLFFSCGSSNSSTTTKTNPHANAHMEMHKEYEHEKRQKELEREKDENTEPTKAQLQKFLLKKNQKGIDFYAMGNEPFWSLDMNFEKGFQFTTMNGVDFVAPAIKFTKSIEQDIIKYKSKTISGEINIQLIKSKCYDNMSGQSFDYQIIVEYKASGDTNSKIYKGCGDYVPDFRLHNIWLITEVEGIKVNPKYFKGQVPKLEIFISDKKILGHDGCNSFNGSFKTEHKKIIIGNLASTMMSCFVNEEISTKITEILSDSILDYSFYNNQLILFKNNKKVMALKHVD